jgi:hypothetical protein
MAKLLAGLAFAVAGCGERALDPSRGQFALEQGFAPGLTAGGDCGGLPTQPDSVRVDLYEPSFSDPINADNPLFPVGELDRVVLLGSVEGEPLRVETTRMHGTRTVAIKGQEVETLISQYVAWVGGRIHEVAIDLYAQDDQGAVWYFGEDVFNYEDGEVADTEGTWLAGQDGPVAMIMPANPEVGDAWRPENACPLVFEEVTATQTGVTVASPRGPVAGALIVTELHMDGSTEDKTFAPGYGEFSTGAKTDLEAVAVAVPIDALHGREPRELDVLSDGAERIFEEARRGRWRDLAAIADRMDDAWDAYRATGVPPMLDDQMTGALAALEDAIDGHDKNETRQASINVSLASADFELRYDDRSEIDLDLIEIWTRQLVLDMHTHDRGGVLGDIATLNVIRDRLTESERGLIDAELRALRNAAQSGDPTAVEEIATQLTAAISRLAS